MSESKLASSKGERPKKDPDATHLEIQYHPSDIRKGVRYLFLSRRQFLWCVGGVTAYVLFMVNAVRIGPGIIRDELARRHYRVEMVERARQGEELTRLVGELEELHANSDAVRIDMAKIYLAYGFTDDESQGQGGYPYEAETSQAMPESKFAEKIRRGNGYQARIAEQMAVLDTFLEEVQAFESEHQDQVLTTPSITPVRSQDFVLTSPFGMRDSPFTKQPDFHAGIDLAASTGTPIYSPADGIVAFAGRYPLKQSVGWWRYGKLVVIHHGERFTTLYGHCDEVKVRGGQKVRQGDVIATVGDTGWSTNPHLHYEVRRTNAEGESQPVDPRIYMLNHEWRKPELLLVRARNAPSASDYEPLPRRMRRR
ncbi:MAG: M23 family metallopeptidase [Acidobacteriota bacterium]